MSFYLGRYAELYDLFYRDKPYADEAQFVYDRLTHLARMAPARILELACGTGNHAIQLARLGAHVTATDVSPDLLAVARQKGRTVAGVSFAEADMTAIPRPDATFDAVICMFDSIGYVQTDENLQKVFRSVRQCLEPGGLFLFEFWHGPAMQKKFDPLRIRRIETGHSEVIRISETTLDRQHSLAHVKYELLELKKDCSFERRSEVQTNRFFTVPEIEAFASSAWFEPLESYAGFDVQAPITDDTWHVISVWKAGV